MCAMNKANAPRTTSLQVPSSGGGPGTGQWLFLKADIASGKSSEARCGIEKQTMCPTS